MAAGLLGATRPSDATAAPAELEPSRRVPLRAALGLRWIGLALMVLVAVMQRHDLQRAPTAAFAIAAAAAVTLLTTWSARAAPTLGVHPTVILLDVTAAVIVQIADGWAFGPDHAYMTASLGAVWVLATAMTAGVALGPTLGALIGAGIGASRLIGAFAPDINTSILDGLADPPPRLLPALTTITVISAIGLGAGAIRQLLQRTENESARLRAHHELAAALHDGVLQSLAYISRRAADPDIARVARDADIELRAYLTGNDHNPDVGNLKNALTAAARRIEHQLACPLTLAIDDELPTRDPDTITAVTGAVTEAITNAAKHASPNRVTVYAAAADTGGIHISVTDDGIGFDPIAVPAGGGLDQSIRARLRAVDGTATITSRPTTGTQVELWIP